MKKSDLLAAYAKDHNKKQIVEFASYLFGFDSVEAEDGGKGSGNFGHKGRPGMRGGSGKGGSSAEGSYTPGQAIKELGKVTRLQARRSADRETLGRAKVSLEKARRPKDTRIGSCEKVAIAMPVGTIVRKNGQDYVKQHNGDWVGKDDTIMRGDMGKLLEDGSADITSVPKVTSYNKAKHNAQLRKKNGYPKGENTDAVKEYSSGGGVKTKNLPNGSGVTKISADDLAQANNTHTLADNCMEVDGQLVLTPEREALHQQVVDNSFEGKEKRPEGKPPETWILGGGPASGKGGFTAPGNKYGIPDNKNQVTIDPDECKMQTPEYALEKDKHVSAAYAHEESSALGKRIEQAAIQNGYNYTLDGTGDNSAVSMMKKIEKARALGDGALVKSAYMTCPTEMAVESSRQRGEKTERFVPEDIVRKTHSKVSHIFPQIASEFDHVELWDRTDGEPKLIASCNRGEQIKVHDEKAYKAFLDKDQEPYDPKKDLFDPRENPYGKGKKSGSSSASGKKKELEKEGVATKEELGFTDDVREQYKNKKKEILEKTGEHSLTTKQEKELSDSLGLPKSVKTKNSEYDIDRFDGQGGYYAKKGKFGGLESGKEYSDTELVNKYGATGFSIPDGTKMKLGGVHVYPDGTADILFNSTSGSHKNLTVRFQKGKMG